MPLPVRAILAAAIVAAAAPSAPRSARAANDDLARDIRGFRPSEHGFAFVNAFSGSPLPVSLGGLENALGAPSTFGLCGGMSFAAADLYLASEPRPEATKQPTRGTPLYSYIYRRQTESLGGSLEQAGRFAAWMRLPNDSPRGTRARSVPELAHAREELEAGRPVALGLVLRGSERPGALWENHQVLAYGVEGAGTAAVRIRIYDPNYPNVDGMVIDASAECAGSTPAWGLPGVRVPVLGATVERREDGRSRATPVRGVFIMPYAPAVPPADIHPQR